MIPYVVTQPSEEPLTLDEAKAHLRVDADDEDDLITAYLTAARSFYEAAIWRSLITQTLAVRMVEWPYCEYIQLPRPPIQSVTSVVYTDSDGNTSTMSAGDYTVFNNGDHGLLWLGYGNGWPSVTLQPGPSIVITYVVGYGLAAAVPELDKQAIRLILGHFYENREEVVAIPGISLAQLPMAVQSIIHMRRAW